MLSQLSSPKLAQKSKLSKIHFTVKEKSYPHGYDFFVFIRFRRVNAQKPRPPGEVAREA